MRKHPYKLTFFNNHAPETILPDLFESPLPPPYASQDAEALISQFHALSRSTPWRLIDSVPFEGPAYEPEGIVRIGPDRFFVSAGEYTSRPVKYAAEDLPAHNHDRSAGAGIAHIIVFDAQGKRVCDAEYTLPGDLEYHNGGIDYDGTWIWAALSEYRPSSTATVIRIDPRTLEYEEVVKVDDHVGTIVADPAKGFITTFNWGSRTAHHWELEKLAGPGVVCEPNTIVRNPGWWIDYQDAKFVGWSKHQELMLASGIADIGGGEGEQPKARIGGVALVDLKTMVPIAEIPVPMVTKKGAAMCKNPMDVALVEGKLRFYFLPDEDEATLYVFESE